MRKIVVSFVLASFVAAAAVAHGGHSHHVLGTVKAINEDHLLVTTKDGKEVEVHLTAKTKYEKASKAATKQDLTAGSRVSVELGSDGKIATSVKIGRPKAE